MVYKYVSSRKIVYSLYDLGVKTTDWEGRIPNWVYKALRGLNCYRAYHLASVPATVVDYKITIPEVVESIQSIEIDGVKLFEVRKNRPIGKEDMIYIRCYTIQNGFIEFGQTDVDVVINAKIFPVAYDAELDTYFPMYPDKEDVEEYLVFACLRRILLRGYVHPIYNLNNNNGETNVNFIVERLKKKARASINRMNNEERRTIGNILVNAYTDQDLDVTRLFN